jgi:hypothetical protein
MIWKPFSCEIKKSFWFLIHNKNFHEIVFRVFDFVFVCSTRNCLFIFHKNK